VAQIGGKKKKKRKRRSPDGARVAVDLTANKGRGGRLSRLADGQTKEKKKKKK